MPENKSKGGRPLAKISKVEFEKLCAMQCTKEEICSWFDITDKTLDAWCKRTYFDEDGQPMSFSEIFKQKRGKGKISLRRAQFKLAEHSASMAIFLGKQYLGQTEQAAMSVKMEKTEDDPLTKSLRELAKKMEDKNAD